MSASSTPEARRKPTASSRVTNGKVLVEGVDQRSCWVRRLKDLMHVHLSDLGGADQATAAEQAIVRRAAVLMVELERMESEFAAAGQASKEQLDLYQRASNSLRRLLESVGLERRQCDVTPDLRRYLEERIP